MKGMFRKALSYGGIGIITAVCSHAYAAGYKLEFQSASYLADAGEAAVIDDAGTNWYNSAGLVYLPQQLVLGGIDLYSTSTFSGNVTAPSTLAGPAAPFGSAYVANGKASSHAFSLLPAVHYALPLGCTNFSLGFSMVPAWGFTEDYGYDSILRYSLIKIFTRTIDLAPSLAWKMNDHWSFGIGPDFHYFSVESKSLVNTHAPAFPAAFGGPINDSLSRFSADAWSYGGHAGILYRFDNATRVGINYRTKINQDLEGFSDFAPLGTGFPIGMFESRNFKLNVPLPPVTTISAYHDMTPTWALMGTLAYDQWSVLNKYQARNYIEPTGPIPVTLPQKMSNTFDLSFGTHYQMNDKWMMRGSIKYIGNPSNTQNRAVNFPDCSKLGIQIGSRYHFSDKVALDLIYGHVWVKTAGIHDLNPVTGSVAAGRERTSLDLFGSQLVWNI